MLCLPAVCLPDVTTHDQISQAFPPPHSHTTSKDWMWETAWERGQHVSVLLGKQPCWRQPAPLWLILPPLPWGPPSVVSQVGDSQEAGRIETDPSNSGWRREGKLKAGVQYYILAVIPQCISSGTITSLGVKRSAAVFSWLFTGAGPITCLTGIALPPSLDTLVTACYERACVHMCIR